ncbi:MAG: exodeoxyribonuclease V subunit gamma, partial [Selenomonadaceae bacterium]|nr:exodeoxyribonuclease V subunit gamma [Selenomonadaceae bacterium]
MLEMIIGRAGTGKTYTCLQSMKEFLERRPLRAKVFLLMPAYMTYKTEYNFTEMVNCAPNTYIYSFQRFAQLILMETGGSNIPKITDIGRRMIMRKIILNRDKNQELKYFSRSAKQRGFGETLADALKELRTYSITPEMLRHTTFNLDNDELCDKITDLAMLCEDYKNAIDVKNYDDEDIIELAAERIEQSQLIKGAEIYIDSFVFFDPQQRKILRALMKYGRNVHITLPMETDLNHKENGKELGLFRQSMKTFIMLQKMAEELKIEMQITRLEKTKRFKRGALMLLEQKMFAFAGKLTANNNKTDSIKILEAANKRVEVEAVAQDILKLHNDKGCRFRDIGILIRDEQYNRLIKPIFEIHEIPYFIDDKRPAVHHPLAELVRSVLELINSRRSEAIFYCLRTGFFNIEENDIDLMENYVIEFGIKGLNSWTNDKSWQYYKREIDDDQNAISEWETERLNKVNEIKVKSIEHLAKFIDEINAAIKESGIKKSAAVRSLSEAIFNLFETLDVPATLERWSREAAKAGNLTLEQEHLKIWNNTVNLFEQFVTIMGDEIIDIKEFAALVNEGIDALQLSLIPPGLDEVTIAKLEQNSLQNSKVIYILGCNEGKMPRTTSEKGLFSDAERYYLIQSGLEISAGGVESSLAEKFLLYRGFTEAQEHLCLSYSLASSEGDVMNRSPLIDTIISLIPDVKREFLSIDILGTNKDLNFIVDEKTLSPQIASKLFAPYRKVRSSVSKLERFMSCPFKHFAQYGLRLEERAERKFLAPDLGNLLHSLLRKFGERMQNENRRWSSVNDEELIIIVNEIFSEIVPRFRNELLLSNSTYKHQLERIKSLAARSLRRLIHLDSVSHFHPEKFEVDFSMKGMKSLTFELNDKINLELSGRIDRIDFDESGKYFLIMDYKTGDAYINLIDIYFGLNLQLLTYLLVA